MDATMPQNSGMQPPESHPQDPSTGTSSSDTGSFDCNICLELAQDPIVTLCGHLFCWPCLYKWLQSRASCKDCPVCKAVVEEEKVVPLYGRGKASTDPRTKPVPGTEIPQRPAGRRPDTARSPEQQYQPHAFGFMAAPAAATAHFGNITLSAGFGLFPSLFGFQVHGIPEGGLGSNITFGGPHGFYGSRMPPATPVTSEQQHEAFLCRLFLLLGCFVILCLLFF